MDSKINDFRKSKYAKQKKSCLENISPQAEIRKALRLKHKYPPPLILLYSCIRLELISPHAEILKANQAEIHMLQIYLNRYMSL